MSEYDEYMTSERERILSRLEKLEADGKRHQADIVRKVWADVLTYRPKPPVKPKGLPVDWTPLDGMKGIR